MLYRPISCRGDSSSGARRLKDGAGRARGRCSSNGGRLVAGAVLSQGGRLDDGRGDAEGGGGEGDGAVTAPGQCDCSWWGRGRRG